LQGNSYIQMAGKTITVFRYGHNGQWRIACVRGRHAVYHPHSFPSKDAALDHACKLFKLPRPQQEDPADLLDLKGLRERVLAREKKKAAAL
jgi:hypothetical protein